MARPLRMILSLMSPSPPEPESPRRIEIRRFPNWRELREWIVGEASPSDPEQASLRETERLQIVVPGTGSAWVLDGMLRGGLPEGSPLPWIGVADRALRDLAGDLEPPFRVAPRLTREILIEEALLAGAGEPEVPPGDPAQLADPLLAFLDEQAKDAHAKPGGSAFEGFTERTQRRLAEAQETDDGARRLWTLTRWLRRTHRRYQEALEAIARVDPGSLRERLFRFAPALCPTLLRTRVLAVGEDALRLADAELFATLLPPGRLQWALPSDAPPPFPRGVLPRWLEVRDAPGHGAPPSAGAFPAAQRKQPTLFSAPLPAVPAVPVPPLKAAPPGATPAPPAICVADSGSGLVCRLTDREAEVRMAASLIQRFRESRGDDFRGYERCALVAQRPNRYLESAETLMSGMGIPLDTHLTSPLSGEPWVAAVSDALEFGARPDRISVGLNLLRNPFFRASDLPVAPARAADILQKQALDAGLRDTNDPETFPALAIRLEGRAEAIRRDIRHGRRSRMNSPATTERRLARAESLETAAAALRTLASASEKLRCLRDPGAGFLPAAEALLDFLEEFLEPPAEGDGKVREAVVQTLRQAAAAAPPGALAGGSERFPRRIRRLLNGRSLRRHPTPDTTGIRRGGVSLIAASDAPFGDYDFLALLGVADADWPGPRPQNIFFPNHLLEEAARSRHSQTRRREIRLLRQIPGLPRTAAVFTRPELDDGFPVAVSPFEIELTEAVGSANPPHSRITFPDRAIADGPPGREECKPLPTTLDRRAPSAAVLERPVSPTALDTCAASPAQFFARYVLRLDEERQLADVPPPTERGELLHEFLQESYRALADSGLAVRESALEDLLTFFRGEFRRFADAREMDATERRGEERWLFGGEAIPGALEWFLREEADRGPSLPVQFEEWIGGEPEPAAPGTPRLRVEGRLDRLDRRPDGTRRIVEYKSGRFYQKPLQARLYARILEAADGTPTDFAIPYFGSRRWVGPEDTPKDAEQDAQLAQIRHQLATGAFPPAPEKDGNFDFHLVIRRDLRERAPEPPTES